MEAERHQENCAQKAPFKLRPKGRASSGENQEKQAQEFVKLPFPWRNARSRPPVRKGREGPVSDSWEMEERWNHQQEKGSRNTKTEDTGRLSVSRGLLSLGAMPL